MEVMHTVLGTTFPEEYRKVGEELGEMIQGLEEMFSGKG